MSDYNPDPRLNDPYRPQRPFEYPEDRGVRSNYAFVALLAIVALVGGVLFFVKPQPTEQQAQLPAPTKTAPMAQPAAPGAPAIPAAPAMPATPATPAEPAAPQQ